MQMPLKSPFTKEIESEENEEYPIEEIPLEFREASVKVQKAEPVFIRLDKFQESLNVFENAKKKINEMRAMLQDLRRIKDQEERELTAWENEINIIKDQVDKIDKEIFSKIE